MGDAGPATSAKLNYPDGLALAPDGTLYFTDTSCLGGRLSPGASYLRKIDPGGMITTIAARGRTATT